MTVVVQRTSTSLLDLIVELAARGEAVEELSATLRDAVSQSVPHMLVPNTIGTVDQLRCQLERVTDCLRRFEERVGTQRAEPQRRKSDRGQRAQDLRGSTDTIQITDLIALLSAQRKTGTLWIHGEDERFVLELVDGAVVHLVSDRARPEQRLGTILVSTNRLSQEKLDAVLQQYGPGDGPLGEHLQAAELVSESDLRDALAVQVQRSFERIFELDQAKFCFRAGAVSELEVRVCLNTTELLNRCRGGQSDDCSGYDAAPAGDPDGCADGGERPRANEGLALVQARPEFPDAARDAIDEPGDESEPATPRG